MMIIWKVIPQHSRAAFLAVAVLLSLGFLFGWPSVAHAAGVSDETQFIINTFSFLIWGAMVMWMCAGFAILEAGSVRTKNASVICLKTIGLSSIAGLAYFFIGYNLMYVDVQQVVAFSGWPFGPR